MIDSYIFIQVLLYNVLITFTSYEDSGFFFSTISYRSIIRVSNSFEPDEAENFVGPNLGLKCLLR